MTFVLKCFKKIIFAVEFQRITIEIKPEFQKQH